MIHSAAATRLVIPSRCVAVGVLLTLAAVGAPLLGQSPEPKNDFVQAVGRFSLALEGSFGDEGARVRSSLDAMARSLNDWDAMIRTAETGMAADLRSADRSLAVRMHMALAGLYLDRTRAADALRELADARQLDQTRADVPMFEALAQSQLAVNDTGATAAFRRASALTPDDPVSAYLLARQLTRIGDAEEATQALQRFTTNETRRTAQDQRALAAPFTHLGLFQETPGVEPFFPPAIYSDGFAELERGNYARAIDEFRRAIDRDSLTGDAGVGSGAMARAAAAVRDGLLDSASEHLAVAIELAPDRAEPHRLLGLVRLANRQPDEAVNELRAAIRLNPRDERARLALSDVLIAGDQLPAARDALLETLAAYPSSGRARYRLGLVFQRQGQYADAAREFTAAIALKPLLGLNSIYQTLGALARAQQQYDAAITAFSRRIDLVPNHPDAHYELGEMYFRQGRQTEALAEFMVTTMLNPSRTDAHAAIGQVHLRNGSYAEAAAAARRAVALDASHKEARYVLATSLVRLGQVEEGKRELDVYQRLQTEATAAQSQRLELEGFRRDASLSIANGEYEKAIALLRLALEKDPQSAASHLDLGIALLKGGHAAEAVERLAGAVARNDHEEIHGYLADAYAALGRQQDSERERAIYLRMRQEALRRAGAGR